MREDIEYTVLYEKCAKSEVYFHSEHERKRLRKEDLTWHELYPNNMKCNPVEGCYSLVFKQSDDRIYCCRWTIKYQLEEVEPGCVSSDSSIEAYNLFEKRIWER